MSGADTPSGGVGAVVVAAGSGTRLGADRPKAFAHLAGRPLLGYAVDTVARVASVGSLVVVVPGSHVDRRHPDWAGVDLPRGTVVVAGGDQRGDSVAAGLAALDSQCRIVLVHDAARCLTPVSVFDRVVAAVRGGAPAAVPGIPLVDTVKEVDETGRVVGTVDRARLRAIQTPQGFRRDVLERAHAEAGVAATDDAALVEAIGIAVVVVEGDAKAIKVTTPDDLVRAAGQLRPALS